MKKLFTLILVLLVSFSGYSQVKKVSLKNDLCKVAAMQKADRMDKVNANVQSQPNMVRFYSEGELDYTIYDWQTNWGNINRTIVWPDGKVNFAYTIASDESFSNQGTGIGTYDHNTDEWIPMGDRIEIERTNFGSIARYRDNGIVVAAEANTTIGVYIVEDKDNMTPGCVPATSYLVPTYDPHGPVVMTSGPERDIIHIVVTGDVTNKLYYFRSTDGGLTWDKENVILPYLTEEYGSFWGSHVAYWMETTEDNCLALVVNNPWSDGMVIYSYDDGETWERKVFYHHPGIHTIFNDWFMYPRWASCVWGVNNELCVAYEFNSCTGVPGSGSYDPAIGGVAFWSENMPYYGYYPNPDPTNPQPPIHGQPFFMDSPYIDQDIWATSPFFPFPTHEIWPEYMGCLSDGFDIEELGMHGDYNCGCVAMPVLAKIPGCDADMVAVWIAMDENHIDDNGNFLFKLFASYSGDGGRTWTPQVNLVNDFMWELAEFVYPQVALVGMTLVIAVQMDGQTGTYVMYDDTDPEDNYYQGLIFELPGVGVPKMSNNTHMTVYPNPAVDRLNIILSQNATMKVYNIMGQKVMSVEGHVGANIFDISNLSSGIYFVRAGNDTQKFIVK